MTGILRVANCRSESIKFRFSSKGITACLCHYTWIAASLIISQALCPKMVTEEYCVYISSCNVHQSWSTTIKITLVVSHKGFFPSSVHAYILIMPLLVFVTQRCTVSSKYHLLVQGLDCWLLPLQCSEQNQHFSHSFYSFAFQGQSYHWRWFAAFEISTQLCNESCLAWILSIQLGESNTSVYVKSIDNHLHCLKNWEVFCTVGTRSYIH